MVKIINGNIWDDQYIIRGITVNCVGVMGKGIAKEFKDRYPLGFQYYCDVVRTNFFKPGSMTFWNCGNCIYFLIATKDHWKDNSQYIWIDHCIENIRSSLIRITKPRRVGLPALGCGNGGLDFNIVGQKMIRGLSGLIHDIDIIAPF